MTDMQIHAAAGDIACRMLQKGLCGEVIGVFSQGIYARFGAELLLLHDAKWGSVPFGIALPDFAAFAATANTAAGESLVLSEDALCFDTRKLPIAVSPAERPAPFRAARPSAQRIADAEQYLLANGAAGGMLDLLAQDRGGARAAVAGVMRGEAEAAVRLIGLGRGLTPSGDEFLCGFFAVADALGETRFSEMRDAVLHSLDRTTAISAAYLGSALTGGYFTVYDAAVRALLSDEPHALLCDFVLGMGASSGTDTLLGAVTAAKLFSPLM